MGIAIVVPNKNYASLGLGTVTPTEEAPLESIVIQNGTAENNTIQFSVQYYPATTSDRGVTWSVVSGGSYATIDSDGLLSIGVLADNSDVTVQAVSTVDQTITATKTVTVTREAVVDVQPYTMSTGTALGNGAVLVTNTPAPKDCKLTKIYCGQYVSGMKVHIHAVVPTESNRQIATDIELDGEETILDTPLDIYAGESVGFTNAGKSAVKFLNESSDTVYYTVGTSDATPTWYNKTLKGNLGYKCV